MNRSRGAQKPDNGGQQPSPLQPTPFHIRDARKEDVPGLAKLHVQTFNETHQGGCSGGPSSELRERQWREAFESNDGTWFCFVAEDKKGALVGFAKGTPHDGGVPGFAGELNKIYVLRDFHRQAIGRLLLLNAARRFLERGVTSMLLFGEATNPSNGFYERFGAERLYSRSGEFHGGYGWRDLHTLVARCTGVEALPIPPALMSPRPDLRLIPGADRQERKAEATELDDMIAMSPSPMFVEECRAFRARILPEDELVEFCTDKHSWDLGMGLAGYSLRRNGTEVDRLITRMN